MKSFDAIVLGTGGVGSAALYELARRGVSALGIDRFHPPHDRGSSHGHTRVVRQAYFEHSNYVPLLLESYRLWRALEQRTGRQLLHEVGLVEIGPADGVVVPGVLRAAAEHALKVEELATADVERRWPGLRVPGNLLGVFESNAGYLLVEDCVAAHLDAARAAGATLLPDTEVYDWSADESGVHVRTSAGDFSAATLVVAAGSWAQKSLRVVWEGEAPAEPRSTSMAQRELRPPLFRVVRKSLFWFESDSPRYDVAAGFPVFLFELPAGVFYGFPKLDARGLKVAEHTGGAVVEDPLAVNREVDHDEQRRLRDFLAACLPEVTPRVTGHVVCLYTMSPDEHFVVDRHPEFANVVFAAGLSGHGFKFTPVLGRVLADLALDGGTDLPIEFLSLRRF